MLFMKDEVKNVISLVWNGLILMMVVVKFLFWIVISVCLNEFCLMFMKNIVSSIVYFSVS